jgi:hypothetical protein
MPWFKKSALVKVPQTLAGVNTQIDAFLAANGFENTLDLKELAAGLLQHETSKEDVFDTAKLAAAMRRMIFNQHLFEVIQEMKAARKIAELEAKLEAAANVTTEVKPQS